jgi:hypothetical protein
MAKWTPQDEAEYKALQKDVHASKGGVAKPVQKKGWNQQDEAEYKALRAEAESIQPTRRTVSDRSALAEERTSPIQDRLINSAKEAVQTFGENTQVLPAARALGAVDRPLDPEEAHRQKVWDAIGAVLTVGGGVTAAALGAPLATIAGAALLGSAGGAALQGVAGPAARQAAGAIRDNWPKPLHPENPPPDERAIQMIGKGVAAVTEMAPNVLGSVATSGALNAARSNNPNARIAMPPTATAQRIAAADRPLITPKGIDLVNDTLRAGIPLPRGQRQALAARAGGGRIPNTPSLANEKLMTRSDEAIKLANLQDERMQSSLGRGIFNKEKVPSAGEVGLDIRSKFLAMQDAAKAENEAVKNFHYDPVFQKPIKGMGQTIANSIEMVRRDPAIRAMKGGKGSSVMDEAANLLARLQREAKALKTGSDALRFRKRSRELLDGMFEKKALDSHTLAQTYGAIRQGTVESLAGAGHTAQAKAIDKALGDFEKVFHTKEGKGLGRIVGRTVANSDEYASSSGEQVAKAFADSGNIELLKNAKAKGMIKQKDVDGAITSHLFELATQKDGSLSGTTFHNAWQKMKKTHGPLMSPQARELLDKRSLAMSVLDAGAVNKAQIYGHNASGLDASEGARALLNQSWFTKIVRHALNAARRHTGYYAEGRNLKPMDLSEASVPPKPMGTKAALATGAIDVAAPGARSVNVQEDAMRRARKKAQEKRAQLQGGGGGLR